MPDLRRCLASVSYVLWLGLICALSVPAQNSVSIKVLSSEGQVEIRRDGTGKVLTQAIAFKANDDLFAGDTIMTGKNGRLVLALSDGSQAVVAPKTTLIIQDLTQSPRTLFQMLKGKTRVHIEKLGGQPNPYRVNTPTAVIAVRGTIFDVEVSDDETQVYLHEGAVDVFNVRQLNQPVFLNAGQMTSIRAAQLPRPPGAFKTGRNDDTFRMREMRGNQTGRADNNDKGRIAQGGQRPDSGSGNGRNPSGGQRQPDINDRSRQPGGAQPPSPQGGKPGGGRRP
ncbi:MAG: FecR domain-containing protein [Acidobacteria bacterium]|nr:FecR domain-containing protein [Acidobacteriota bacterium]